MNLDTLICWEYYHILNIGFSISLSQEMRTGIISVIKMYADEITHTALKLNMIQNLLARS